MTIFFMPLLPRQLSRCKDTMGEEPENAASRLQRTAVARLSRAGMRRRVHPFPGPRARSASGRESKSPTYARLCHRKRPKSTESMTYARPSGRPSWRNSPRLTFDLGFYAPKYIEEGENGRFGLAEAHISQGHGRKSRFPWQRGPRGRGIPLDAPSADHEP